MAKIQCTIALAGLFPIVARDTCRVGLVRVCFLLSLADRQLGCVAVETNVFSVKLMTSAVMRSVIRPVSACLARLARAKVQRR